MEHDIALEPLSHGTLDTSEQPQPAGPLEDLRRLSEVPVEVTVEVGRAQMTVGETLGLHAGSILTLNRMSGEPVDLLVNGTLIARGEVVVVDEQFGLRVTQVLGEPSPLDTPLTTSEGS